MKESIIIRNFGPIKDIEIEDIRPLTFFIGESGSGKSTVLKTVVLFRWIYKMINIRSYLKHANISQSPFKFNFKDYLKNNGFTNYVKDNTEIIYRKGNNKIVYDGALDVSITVPEEELSLEKMCFIADKRILIPDILASKGKKNKIPMSFFLEETYNDFNIASEFIKTLDINYLNVRYASKETNSGTKYYIESLDEQESYTINLEDSSSGTQTIVPLSIIIEYFSKYYDFSSRFNKIIFKYMSESDNLKDFRSDLNIGDIPYKNIHIHIEEPELSLYPESQKNLLNFIINRCFLTNSKDYQMSLMMATHSPYIINHLNLLIMAGQKEKMVENAFLNFADVNVFEIVGGYLNDLKREGNFFIDTRVLSNPIADTYKEYDNLLKEKE
ncbi:AAA family ATPase [Dysgonomonas sp. ZJ709]|uniref:AAA family ATPase n=1 Tax=Dysgonomonas sp. ZJ709 TaxID=2709797 RepID=UPI0013ED4396|nr:AAA family ATPase [Dysgonomonas sp. ZJ709]